ncbi:MAG: cytochrome b/b6 domain-containing protein [Rubrivivax sp.]|nr:cytochrome b/b6 domain-containing protein [Rubrivivax sp.]
MADAVGLGDAGKKPAPAGRRILVWDAPVRVFHWLTVLSFAGAYITAESERWRLVHVTLGYTLAGLVLFRVLWGLLGTRHARFASFVRGPAAVRRYVQSLLSGQPEHHTGHNPAGALAIVALLALALGVTASGYAGYEDLAGEWVNEVHEVLANGMLFLVGLHVAAVVLASKMHSENLVRAMFTGHKLGSPQEAIRRAWKGVAVLMLVAVAGFWWTQWQAAPATAAGAGQAAIGKHLSDDDDD